MARLSNDTLRTSSGCAVPACGITGWDKAPANTFTRPSACLPGTNTGIDDAMAELFKNRLVYGGCIRSPGSGRDSPD